MAPRGSWLYARALHAYPIGDPVGYASLLGCRAIALQHNISAHIASAPDATAVLGQAYITAGPADWAPGAWRRTSKIVASLAGQHSAGAIVDFETADLWADAASEELDELADSIVAFSLSGMDIGVTSFPAHPLWTRLAARARDAGAPVWGSPQFFASDRRHWTRIVDEWAAFPGGVYPTVAYGSAGRWTRDADAYRDYADAIVNILPRPVGLWHPLPAPAEDSAYFAIAKDIVEGIAHNVPGCVV